MRNAIAPRDLLLIFLVILLWGMNFVPMIYALHDLTPLQLGTARFLFSSLPFIAFVARPKVSFRWILFYAATQGFGQFMLLFIALTVGMPAGIASLLMQIQVFFTTLMGVVLFKESLSGPLRLGLVISGIGLACFIVSVQAGDSVDSLSVLGLVLTLTAAAMWAASNIIVKKIHLTDGSFDPLGMVVWSGLVSGLIFLLVSLLWEVDAIGGWQQASLKTWVSLLYLGLIANGFGYWVWSRMLSTYPVSSIAPFSLGVPVVGMMAGVVILGESVTALQWVGAVLIMSALVFVVFPRA